MSAKHGSDMSSRRDRHRRKALVFLTLGAVVWFLAFFAGMAFELGRWVARMDTDNPYIPW